MPQKHNKSTDPEVNRWNRKYPDFPSLLECVNLIKRGNLSGTWIDIIADGLAARASAYLNEMIEIFPEESEVQIILVAAIAEARLPQAVPFLSKLLDSENHQVRQWAVYGLQQLDTGEARTVLWRNAHP